MKISYNWIKEYIDIDLDYIKASEILTDIGLEVEGIEKFQSIKGGLEGFVIGEVKEKKQHPNADKLSVTKVDIGNGDLLNIVCGAPNVDAGQKVVVATIGTTMHAAEEPFQIKKTKLRGELSEGMICAEDELGIGISHDGIMVLEKDTKIGIPASEYFNIESDIVFEIGLTPNRIDSASHIGVARDVAAFLNQEKTTEYNKPSIDSFKTDDNSKYIDVIVENTEVCPRYSGVTISGIEIKESPEWLKNRLKAIGLNPINNVVDITNFVLQETGHPLHAFNADKIKGDKIFVKTLKDKTNFVTLDEETRELSSNDLMICNTQEGMCIAGVFGGIDSGVDETTKNIFIESACFNPVSVRKTAKRHMLSTDSSFRFERGVDPNDTIYALKRAAILIKEIAGGKISSDIVDVYPKIIEEDIVKITYKNIYRLIGKNIEKGRIKKILKSLEIIITEENEDFLIVSVPTYRVDVKREVDVIEEILRIYGYNNIEIPEHVNSALSYIAKPNNEIIKSNIADYLSNNGFAEIISNSLTKSEYYDKFTDFGKDTLVQIFNPLSNDLDVMRNNLLFGGLEAVNRNVNRKRPDLKLYEYGNVYFCNKEESNDNPLKKYSEHHRLMLLITGNEFPINWRNNEKSTFFELKSFVDNIFLRFSLKPRDLKKEYLKDSVFQEGISYKNKKTTLVSFGILSNKLTNIFGIDQTVFYADFAWANMMSLIKNKKTEFKELPKFPEVRRDLALLIDENIQFDKIEEIAFQIERKILKDVILFDVYKGKNIEEGKKSYAVSFILQDETKTLTDKYIDKVVEKFINAYKKELNAVIR